MAIHFSDLITQLNMPALFTNIADDSIRLEHGVYPAAFAVEPDPATVYIGNNEEIEELVEKFASSGITLTLITTNMPQEMIARLEQYNNNLLCVKGSISQVYYTASSILASTDEISFPSNALNRFVAELLENKIETLLELNTKADAAGLKFKNRYVLMLVKPADRLTKRLFEQLTDLELGFATCVYKGTILTFFEAENTGEHPGIDIERMKALLKRNLAHAAFSTTSTQLSSLSLYYEQCLDTIRLGKKLGSEEERIFHVEDYLIYQAIDTLSETVRYKHNRISYLSNPLLMKLYRYDKQHDENLYKVTEAFIKSGNNISQTASALFLHRNTVTNKIKKAEEIMGKSFDDVKFCHALYFSFIIYNYVNKIWNIDADTLLPQPQSGMLK
jgi:hypothetical protein